MAVPPAAASEATGSLAPNLTGSAAAQGERVAFVMASIGGKLVAPLFLAKARRRISDERRQHVQAHVGEDAAGERAQELLQRAGVAPVRLQFLRGPSSGKGQHGALAGQQPGFEQALIRVGEAVGQRSAQPFRMAGTAYHHIAAPVSGTSNTGKVMPWEYQEVGATIYGDVPARFETNDVDAEAGAVLAGVGIGQIPSYIAAPLIREGRLVHLLARLTTERIGLFIYYAQRTHLRARARLFIDFAIARLLARSSSR